MSRGADLLQFQGVGGGIGTIVDFAPGTDTVLMTAASLVVA